MKRTSSGKAKASPKINANLLKWVKELHEKADMNHVLIQVNESNMCEWDVVFTAEMFRSEPLLRFEYLADSGAYAECSQEAQSAFALVYNAWKEQYKAASECFQFGATFYEACIDARGVLSQRNLTTDVVRPIRQVQVKDDFHDELITWFKKNKRKEVPGVHLHISFQPDFPGSPPFVQVIRPRFQQWTGHVTIGGSMCTELLTGSGWKPDISAMGLILQLQNNLVEGGAKVDHYNVHDYTKTEALEAFKRVARDHGWKIPSSLK